MRGRHLQTLIALVLAGLWGFGVYFAHRHGHLGFLDRIESTMTDLRTLARGARVPPDLVTIVAIDDTLVKQGGSYPVARADLARIVDAIAKLAQRPSEGQPAQAAATPIVTPASEAPPLKQLFP